MARTPASHQGIRARTRTGSFRCLRGVPGRDSGHRPRLGDAECSRRSRNAPSAWPPISAPRLRCRPASASWQCCWQRGENDCQFIWNAHAPPARRDGLRDELVDALRDRKELPNPADDELAVINYGREFFRTRRVSQEAFDAVVAHFGVNGATELTTLMGCYAMLAFNVNAFGVELPDDRTEEALPI